MATTTMTMAKALNEGLRRAMEKDPKVLLMGEDIGKLGGVFRITDGLQKDFGQDRVIDTPLAESAIVGTAVFTMVASNCCMNRATATVHGSQRRTCSRAAATRRDFSAPVTPRRTSGKATFAATSMCGNKA